MKVLNRFGLVVAFLLGGGTSTHGLAREAFPSRQSDVVSPVDMQDDVRQLVRTLEAVHPNLYFRLNQAEARLRAERLLAQCSRPLDHRQFDLMVADFIAGFSDDHTVAYPVRASPETPPAVPAESWRFALLTSEIGYLDFRLMRERTKWQRFLRETFAALAAQQVRTLIIDLRNNDGGDSSLGDDLLAYLTDRPYRPAARKYWRFSATYLPQIASADPWGLSAGDPAMEPPVEYRRLFAQNPTPEFKAWLRANAPSRARAILERHAPHWLGLASSDSPVTETLYLEFSPQAPERPPLPRYQGRVCFLISGCTFSSAVILANIVEDFRLGPLIGEETKMCNQFGEPFRYTLPHSRLRIDIATAQYVRANGDATDPHGVRPTIPVSADVHGADDPALATALQWAKSP